MPTLVTPSTVPGRSASRIASAAGASDVMTSAHSSASYRLGLDAGSVDVAVRVVAGWSGTGTVVVAAAGTSDGWRLTIDQNRIVRAQWLDGGSVIATAGPSAALTEGAWHHLAVTASALGTGTLYVDGVADADTASLSGAQAPDASLRCGGWSGLTGSLDVQALGYYGVALSAAQVARHAAAQRAGE